MADHEAHEPAATLSAAAAEAATAAIEAGRRLFAGPCRFTGAAADLASVPAAGAPEVAFAGRSNVGKSSLINALTGRNSLARTSHTPGRTQQINFFDLGGRLTLVDLPGYGYANAPKESIARWTRLVEAFLKGRAPLRRACLLVDARHGLKDSDRTMMSLLDGAAVAYHLVLTKGDKLKPAALAAAVASLDAETARRPAAVPGVLCTSAHTGLGLPELRAVLASLVPGLLEETT